MRYAALMIALLDSVLLRDQGDEINRQQRLLQADARRSMSSSLEGSL